MSVVFTGDCSVLVVYRSGIRKESWWEGTRKQKKKTSATLSCWDQRWIDFSAMLMLFPRIPIALIFFFASLFKFI